jgi:toxin ParE1/3/4
MKRYTVIVSRHAADDTQDIAHYISSELHEKNTAEKLVEKLYNAMDGLSHMPARFPLITDVAMAEKGIRKLPVENYIVFFKIYENDDTVSVIRVLYNRRDWGNLI